MQGPPPKMTRRRRNVPVRGEWQATPGIGWQYEPVTPPDGLLAASRDAWQTWMGAWYAAHWTPNDLPSLRQLVRLYDQVERGEFQRSTELRYSQDTWGITPKGQQDRRWKAPEPEEKPVDRPSTTADAADPYRHLRAVV